MNRNYTRIAIIIVVIFTFVSGDYLLSQQITKIESNYDLGIAAYKRGHYTVALYDFEARATQGDNVAQFCLAFMYKHGYGVKESKSEAKKWYEKSAEQGYAPAQNNLGVLYVRRAEVAEDESMFLENSENAKKWFKMAADQRYPLAQFNLYVLSKKQENLDWLVKAAEQGYAPAQNTLGILYSFGSRHFNHGDSIPIDFQKAVEWYREAAVQGYADAQRNLGICYEEGKGVEQNHAEAFKWHEKSAKQNYASGQFSLGLSYLVGRGVVKNAEKAFMWFFKSAEKGNVKAQNNLAAMYNKRGNKGDIEMANRWYQRAAQQGQSVAQSSIGENFEKGLNKFPQDDAEAYFWYSLALKDKSTLGKTDIIDLVDKITNAQERIRKSFNSSKIAEIDRQIENWEPKQLSGSGTGFYIDNHYILTNAHVVTDHNTGKVLDEFRIPYRRVELFAYDPEVDLALLYDERENTDSATFRLEHVEFGEKVSMFGYPRSNRLSYEGNIASGDVSGTSYIVNHPQFENRFQYTAPTQRGNSGGPVFDSTGMVIGVSVAQLLDDESFFVPAQSMGVDIPQTINLAQNTNFAIKSNVVERFISKVKDSGNLDDLAFRVQKRFNFNIDRDGKIQSQSITLPEQRAKAETFTVPVLCFKNKENPPLKLMEADIAELKH